MDLHAEVVANSSMIHVDPSRDNGRMKERAGARKLMRAHGPGSYEESPQAVRSRMKREGKWKGDFKATRG